MQHLTRETCARVADSAAAMGPEVITKMVESAQREDAWAELIPVTASMSPENIRMVTGLDVWDDEALAGVVRAAERDGLWDCLRTIAAAMDPDRARQLSRVLSEIDGTGERRAELAAILDG
jgi:hypothetical protein